ncbi:MAG: hypothetical protein JO296_21330 [Pseudonocardiales bacterium]|nr:hypothetical protein [Pseudonocardiales bacterium]
MSDSPAKSPHKMNLQQHTRPDGHLTGYCRAWCDCGEFDLEGAALTVSSASLAHQGQELEPGFAHFIIMDRSGLFGVSFDATQAHETAQAIGGALVTVPLAADYRGLANTQAVNSDSWSRLSGDR